MDKFAELLRLRKLHDEIVKADLERRRYRHLMNDFVHSGRVLFGDSALVYRDVHAKIFDYDVFTSIMKESDND